MKMTWNRKTSGTLKLPELAAAGSASLVLALGLSACQNIAGFSQPSLVRVIDASYIAPAVNVYIEKTLFAGNIVEGYISNYGTVSPSVAAQIQVTQATGGKSLVEYTVTVLEDQQTAAAAGHSAFRFLNQAPRTGAVDVYMVPSSTTLANTIPLCTALPVGSTCGYISFASEAVTLVITPTGAITPKYTSTALGLVGGEVRTVVMVDSQLTSNPPVNVVIAKDVN